MADLINQIAAFIEALIVAIGYPGIFLMLLAENLFPPVPTEPLMPFAGMLVSQGKITFVLAWASAIAGATVGSVLLYWIGKQANERVIRAIVRRYGRYIGITEAELDKGAEYFNRYGALSVFFGRMIPMLRGPVSLVAGMSKMHIPTFTLFSALSAAAASGFWLGIGVVLGENWKQVIDLIRVAEPYLPLIALAALSVLGITWLLRKRRAVSVMRSDAPESPA
jgi:membrane protein DedA with SNARE-associated domain